MARNTNINKNAIYNTIKSVMGIIYPLITFPYVSRVLQAENVGKINFSHSIVSYYSLIASLGVSMYAIRECAKYRDDRDELGRIASEILTINIFSTSIAYIALVITLLITRPLDNYRFLIIISSITIGLTTLGADWLNTAMEDFKFITFRTLGMQILSLVLLFIFVREPKDYIKYAIISVIASSGANVINIVYRRKYCKTKFCINRRLTRHLPPILRLFAMLCAQSILTSCDTTVIGLVLGDLSTGLYSTALKVYNIAVTLTASITWVVVPQLSYAFSRESLDEIRKLFRYSLNYSFVLGVPIATGMLMVSKEIVFVIAGPSYAGADTVLRLLSVTYALTLFSNFYLNIYMLASGQDKVSMKACFAAAIFNLLGNIMFIPRFGINAAACTTMVSQFVIIVFCLPYRDRRINTSRLLLTIVQPLMADIGLIAVIITSKCLINNMYIDLLISIVVGGCVYFGLLFIMNNEFVIEMKAKVFKR